MPWDQATRKQREATTSGKVRIIEPCTAVVSADMSFCQIRAEIGISHTQVAEIY
ncbi:hypothetical protein L873DRAFT_1816953 [Choiromyces venosus 120613-1]|uniref:Uncharacterized protein n=1 Tax=Choiromyces venosus 120613-1 TaxID=1336337 RepID=A0A3N4J477_9PEZI|nr:hypothetical protein L873DRAFT_1816953 [Choiromyces venosus 120613-1]